MTWKSDQYIGVGGDSLEFARSDSIGYTEKGRVPHTFARLDNVQNDSGVLELTSELHIIASVKYKNPSVTCRDNCDRESNVEFEVLGMS